MGKDKKMLQKETYTFLRNLKKNNHKLWFDAHRDDYELAKQQVIDLSSACIQELGKLDVRYTELEAKKCLFRINRDVRFSKNKEPYKTNIGAAFSIGGKKSQSAGFYVHIEPGATFVGGGIWQPEPDILKKIRQEIDYNGKEFLSIVESKKYVNWYGGLSKSDQLRSVPKGFEPNHLAHHYLKMKSFTSGKSFSDQEAMDKTFLPSIKKSFQILSPLVEFLNRAVQ